MSEQSKTCSQCNAELPTDSASSLCSQCLLKIGFETQQGPDSEQQSSSAYRPTFLPPTIQELAPHFPQLEILEVLGHGGMGVVYKARQIELDRLVALKILRPNISHDAGFTERFLREARALAKLNHPNIITVYDFGRKDALYFFIMEFVDGTNLRHVERVGQLSPATALNIVPQICSALQYAHDNGVVHRDIKPENILLTKSGDIRIADFGLAKLAGTEDHAPLTGTWQVMGTPHYMAPEQFEKPTTVDHRADIYSLGVVIYELLTGELPIGRFRLPSEKVQVDVRLDEVVLRSLDKEPDRRYQRVTDVATAVEAASSVRQGAATHIQQAKHWAQKAATSVRERAQSLRSNTVGWEAAFRSVINWLGDRSKGIGSALMWVGAVNAVIAFAELINGSSRVAHSSEMGAPAMIAGSLAFWFGRQLRRNAVSKPLRWFGLFCLLPIITDAIFPDVCRMVFMALGLIASLQTKPSQNSTDPQEPDIVDKVVAGFERARAVMTRRMLLLTIFGIGGWCLVSAASIGGCFALWFYTSVPSTFDVTDTTAQNVRLAFDDSVEFSIVSSESTEWHGMSADGLEPVRNTLELRGQSKHGKALVEFDFDAHTARTPVGSDFAWSSIGRDAVEHWMSSLVNDIRAAEHQKQIDNLYDVVRLMMSTRGLTKSLRENGGSYTTLNRQLERLIRDPEVSAGLIPVGRLLDPELFRVSRDGLRFTQGIRPQDSAIFLFVLLASIVWLVGTVRVLRVLYQHVWQPAMMPVSDEATTVESSAGIKWRWCSVALMVNGLLASLAMIFIFSQTSLPNQSGWHAFLPLRLPVVSFVPMYLLLLVSFSIALGALLARPAFRTMGLRVGLLSAAAAILTVPLSLITFPAGLAAWILLTSQHGKALFVSRGTSIDSMVPAAEVN